MDNPSRRGRTKDGQSEGLTEAEHKVLSQYFHDLYGVFVKKLGYFVVEPEVGPDDEIKLQAMLQELIKIKKLGSK
jgi:ABC-type Zn2+ transport system substrate-binding protein/surface adhesin